MLLEKKNCLHCGKAIHGRSDKKFCDDYCRNSHNNQKRTGNNPVIRKISGTLKMNRNILESVISDGLERVKVPKMKLAKLGYQFKYQTHSYTNWKGNVYSYCFDFGFLDLGDGWVLVVKDTSDELLSWYLLFIWDLTTFKSKERIRMMIEDAQ